MSKLLFTKEPTQSLKMAVLFFLSLLLLVLDQNYALGQTFRRRTIGFIYVLQKVVSSPFALASHVSHYYSANTVLRGKMADLEFENWNLKAQNLRLQYLEDENTKLRSLLGTGVPAESGYQVAELEVSHDVNKALINKGKKEGVVLGQMVIDSAGLIGQVIDLDQHFSKILLITDLHSGVPIEFVRNGIKANALGLGDHKCLSLFKVPKGTDIKEGDLAVTSGLGGKYKPGYPVGRVSVVSDQPEQHFLEVLLQPSSGLERSKWVFLVN